jgi:hypothetical protein
MGLDLQPCFIYNVQRQSTSAVVVVEVVDSRTDVLNDNGRAAQLVESLMGRAKSSGKSVIQAKATGSSHCRLEIDLTLRLHVPLPPFVPIPPGLNSIGSTLVKRTGTSRTGKLLEDLKRSYLEWAEQAASNESG